MNSLKPLYLPLYLLFTLIFDIDYILVPQKLRLDVPLLGLHLVLIRGQLAVRMQRRDLYLLGSQDLIIYAANIYF
jgi:hypothetical protein